MVNEFAHNAYVNKSDGLEMNLPVSTHYIITTLKNDSSSDNEKEGSDYRDDRAHKKKKKVQ